MSPDPLTEAAALIRDVGRSAQRARRYRALASALAEPTFDRALTIGSELRRAARGAAPSPGAAIASATAELRNLLASCEGGIDGVKASSLYRDAVASFAAGEAARVVPLASEIFTDVGPHSPRGSLYWAVPMTSGQTGEHFLPPEDCASRLVAMASEGIRAPTQPPELGGDETIRPILLSDEHDGSEGPIALAFEPHALPGPVCRLAGSNVILFYADRMHAEFSVACVASVNDEWWKIRPDAYREYLDELRAALRKQPIPLVMTP